MISRPLALDLDGVTVGYGGGRGQMPVFGALDVSLQLEPSQIAGLVGESGSGKTTLMKAIVGMVGYSGRIKVDGTDPLNISNAMARRKWLAQKIGVVFQDAGGSLVPRMSVLDQVMLPMKIHGIGTAAQRQAKARELLDLVKLPTAAGDRSIEEISGGQRQRVAIARSLVLDPVLLIADEPTSALDISVRAQLIKLLDELRTEQGAAILVISHDLTTIEYLADTVAVMYRGSIVEAARSDDLQRMQHHPYSRDLWNASPRLDRAKHAFTAHPTFPDRSTEGCRYAPRCDRWTDACSVALPDFTPEASPRVRCLHPLTTEDAV